MELNKDVTFEEDVAYRRSRRTDSDSDEQDTSHELLASPSPLVEKETLENDSVDPTDLVDPVVPDSVLRDTFVLGQRRRPAWVRRSLQDVDEHVAPRPFQESKRPHRYGCYVALMSSLLDSESSTYDEASRHLCWRDVMTEYDSIMQNDVWEIIPRLEGKSVVTSKWIFKIKHATNGSIQKYKARFVARGFSQREGVDYDETFALVARFTSIHTIIALASTMRWRLYQMNVKTTFLNGEIEEEVYVEHSDGFAVHGKESHVCGLKKTLYGLKHAPRAWYGWIDGFLVRLGFTKSDVDSTLYYKVVERDSLILVLYVDDLFLTGAERLVTWCKE